jgi:hypothetical protein
MYMDSLNPENYVILYGLGVTYHNHGQVVEA